MILELVVRKFGYLCGVNCNIMSKIKKYKENNGAESVLEDNASAVYINGDNEEVRSVSLSIPQSDMKFFKELIKKMGWKLNSKESLLDEFISSRPKDVDLSEDDIMEEVKSVRYGKKDNY